MNEKPPKPEAVKQGAQYKEFSPLATLVNIVYRYGYDYLTRKACGVCGHRAFKNIVNVPLGQ